VNGSMRIGFSVAHASQVAGGISEVVRGLGRALVARDVQLRVFAGEDEHIPVGTECWEGLDIFVSPVRGPRSFGYQPGLRRAVAEWKPTSMHVHGLWMYPSWATRHLRLTGTPYVVAPHGMIDRWALSHSAWKKRLALTVFERASLENAACLQALTESELASIRDLGLTNPVAVIPNGVDIPTQRAIGGGDRKIMLFLGRLHPKKGLAELLQAWKLVSDRRSTRGWRLAIAGWNEGGHGDELLAMRDALGLAEQVNFLGPVFGADKARALAGADAFVLPSKSEGLPMAVLEAWSYSLPVLMTPECNLSVGYMERAAVRISSEPPALANDLAGFLAQSDSARSEIGTNGRNLVERVYRWEAIADQLIWLHRWIAGRANKPNFVETIP